MVSCLPGLSGPARELRQGPLWIRAPRANLVAGERACLAVEGFLATGGDRDRGLAEIFAAEERGGVWVSAPEGHYVLAFANHESRALTLLRSPSGGERLCFVRLGDLVLFASSIRPLLAHSRVSGELDPELLDEVLINGLPIFGSSTPFLGVEEVLPGNRATFRAGEYQQRCHWRGILASPRGPVPLLARRFRESLTEAVEQALGPHRPVAVALSGGIDSSAVAAAAVEAVGAENVRAYTYEFDDPTHGRETHFAELVVRRLGIRYHEVFKVSFRDFLDAIPEGVWRSESPVHWPKSFLLPVARHLKRRGHRFYLTGFGIGSHMSYLRELGRVLPWVPFPGLLLRYWRLMRFEGRPWLERMACLHPGLEPPHRRIYHLLSLLLEREGYLDDHRVLHPPEALGLLGDPRPIGPGESNLLRGGDHGALQRHCFAHHISCIDVTRSEKSSREVGVLRISPAHFACCLPYAYFPVEPAPFVWGDSRRLRPGKLLLRKAFRGILPDEVLFRKKSWADAVASPRWLRQGRVMMLRALPSFPDELDALGSRYPEAVRQWEPSSILSNCLSFWFWRRLMTEFHSAAVPPRWEELVS